MGANILYGMYSGPGYSPYLGAGGAGGALMLAFRFFENSSCSPPPDCLRPLLLDG
jgi:hypothetical protein